MGDLTITKVASDTLRFFVMRNSPFRSRNCAGWGVVTTIFHASDSFNATADVLHDWCFVVVADMKGPSLYNCRSNAFYLNVGMQRQMGTVSKFVKQLPWNHFGRKNIGYLWAILHGASYIWDFDDDNKLSEHFAQLSTDLINTGVNASLSTLHPNVTALLNPFTFFGQTSVWPRGYPLPKIKESLHVQVSTRQVSTLKSSIAVVQSLADYDPDVDAIFRLTRYLPVSFVRQNGVLLVPKLVFSPFNAQATLYYPNAFWAMFLPISVHGRVSDIWRSYFSQRLFWDMGLHASYTDALVVQHRNPHSYLADFHAEQQLYHQTPALLAFLTSWTTPDSDIRTRYFRLFVALYEHGFIELADVDIVRLWLQEAVLTKPSFFMRWWENVVCLIIGCFFK